jgi:hypothetical protein
MKKLLSDVRRLGGVPAAWLAVVVAVVMLGLAIVVVLGTLLFVEEQRLDSTPKPVVTSKNEFYTICLDGVSYWVRKQQGQVHIAVYIDPTTLHPKNCK